MSSRGPCISHLERGTLLQRPISIFLFVSGNFGGGVSALSTEGGAGASAGAYGLGCWSRRNSFRSGDSDFVGSSWSLFHHKNQPMAQICWA